MSKLLIDLLHEIGQILSGIAWPSVTLIIDFAFRKQIANSTPALLNNIKKLKYGKFEAEFDRVYKEAQKLELPEVKRVDELDIDITTEIVDEYRKLAEVSPRITIMQAWMSFEKTVLECFEELSSKSVPSLVQCFFSTSSLCFSDLTSPTKKWLISAHLAAYLRVRFSPPPPTMIGTGFCTGCGLFRTLSTLYILPS